MKIWGIVGWKNSGKTGLMERLVTEFCDRGLSVSTIKHAHHAFDIDKPGKDSFRHRAAGATEVLLASDTRFAVMHELRGAPEPTLEALLARLAPVDLVLIEGYKRDRHPKVETWREGCDVPLISEDDPTIRAIATDAALADASCPVLDLNDVRAVADFIAKELDL
ncbi:MAG: molybdopterin-guanine dinucleotide biosynthesis protein B [Pseudomonadota bacterium]